MECEWSVDETDGCTLRLQCKMKDACDKDECFDLDMLVEKALHAPRYFTDAKLITGKYIVSVCFIGVCRTPMYSVMPVFRNPKFEHNESQGIAINVNVTS